MLFTFILGLFFLGSPPGSGVKPKLEPHEALYKIYRWIDTSMGGYEDVYDKLKEMKFQTDKTSKIGNIFPTYYRSPFDHGDWCQAIKKEEPDFLSEG